MTNPIQVSENVNGRIYVLAGNTFDEFKVNAANLLGIEAAKALVADFQSAFGAVTPAAAPAPERPAQWDNEPWAQQQSGPSLAEAVQSVSQILGATPVQQEASRTVADKWGTQFTYGAPGAPACPHGPRLLLNATGKSGKPYTAWACQVTGPEWRGDRTNKCEMVFPQR